MAEIVLGWFCIRSTQGMEEPPSPDLSLWRLLHVAGISCFEESWCLGSNTDTDCFLGDKLSLCQLSWSCCLPAWDKQCMQVSELPLWNLSCFDKSHLMSKLPTSSKIWWLEGLGSWACLQSWTAKTGQTLDREQRTFPSSSLSSSRVFFTQL